MKPLAEFYSESRTKAETRSRILEAVLQLALHRGMEHFTMQTIAEMARITPRNLYRYYENRDLLIVDAVYNAMQEFSQQENFQLDESMNGIDQLVDILRWFYLLHQRRAGSSYAKVEQVMAAKLLLEFDLFFVNLAKDNPAYLRYTELYLPQIRNKQKTAMESALAKGIQDRSIHIKEEEISFYIEYITQSMRGISDRVALKEHERPTINAALVEKNIEVIRFYLSGRL